LINGFFNIHYHDKAGLAAAKALAIKIMGTEKMVCYSIEEIFWPQGNFQFSLS